MKLTNIKCKNTNYNPEGTNNKLSDGGGLFLHIKSSGKYWRMNYRFLGKQKTLALGVYPQVSLLEAREKRDEAKKLLANGQDPCEKRKLDKLELKTNHENNFKNIAREWHEQKKHTWSPKHAETILKRLEANMFSKIGSRPIKEITAPEILEAVRALEAQGKHDLAHRQLQHCSQILRYAIATGRAVDDVTRNLKGALKPVKTKNHPYITEQQLPDFLSKLDRYEEDYNGNRLTKLAFQLLILTFVRSGELRGAKWDEIDWDKAQWKIPAERMKMKEPHIVPLAKQSIAILKQIHEITGYSFNNSIFPSQHDPRKTMSENTFARAIKVFGYKGKATAHGFRSTASTILNENNFKPDVIERQLAHAERNQVRAAYNYAEYIPERMEMMQWWANYLDKTTSKSNDN